MNNLKSLNRNMDHWEVASKLIKRALKRSDPLDYIIRTSSPYVVHMFRKLHPEIFDIQRASLIANNIGNSNIAWYLYGLKDEEIPIEHYPLESDLHASVNLGLNALPNEIINLVAQQDSQTYNVMSQLNHRFRESTKQARDQFMNETRAAVYFVNFDRITRGIPGVKNDSMYMNDYYHEKRFDKIVTKEFPLIKHGDVIVTIREPGTDKDEGLFMYMLNNDNTYELIRLNDRINDEFASGDTDEETDRLNNRYHPRYWDNVKQELFYPINIDRIQPYDLIEYEPTETIDNVEYYKYSIYYNSVKYIVYEKRGEKNYGWSAHLTPYTSLKYRDILTKMIAIEKSDNVLLIVQ